MLGIDLHLSGGHVNSTATRLPVVLGCLLGADRKSYLTAAPVASSHSIAHIPCDAADPGRLIPSYAVVFV
jgi:hypothetical protein